MALPDPKFRAGPPGRARMSPTLMRRPLGEPRMFKNASLLATNRRTARGVVPLNLGLNESPAVPVAEQMARIEAKVNEIVANLVQRGLMEKFS